MIFFPKRIPTFLCTIIPTHFEDKSSVLSQNVMPVESNACFLFKIILFKQVTFLANIVGTNVL